MLSLTHPDIYNKLQKIEKEIKKEIEESLNRKNNKFILILTNKLPNVKNHNFTELLKSFKNDTELEKKYTGPR